MLICDKCEGAYHLSCCKVDEETMKNSRGWDNWRCVTCLKGKQTMKPSLKEKIPDSGNEESSRPSYVNTSFPPEKQEQLATLLWEYMNSLNQGHHEMLGQSPEITAHEPEVYPSIESIEQPSKKMKKLMTLEEAKNKPYSFRKDKVIEILRMAVYHGLQLPKSKRPNEADKFDDPNFGLYHRA
jgi:hypothetical protein